MGAIQNVIYKEKEMTDYKFSAEDIQQRMSRVRECLFGAMVVMQEELARMTGISRSTVKASVKNRRFLSSLYALLIHQIPQQDHCLQNPRVSCSERNSETFLPVILPLADSLEDI